MAKHIRCGKLFNGLEDDARIDQTIVVDDASITFVGPSAEAPKCTEDDTTVDHSQYFVMPGLIDIHVHLAYGNSKCSEDTDLYAPLEFRALRGLINAQRVLNAGYTSMADPGTSGRVTLAIRDAINAGLFVGPRIITSGPYISSRQGLTDWYPSWFGNPSTAIARVVHDMDEAIEEIRVEVKDGVDFIKLAMDGRQLNAKGEIVATFNQAQTTAMVDEAHRLGKKVAAHARGREAVLYSARAGVDVIFHASWIDDAGLDAALQNKCAICPTLTLPLHINTFLQPTDPGFRKWRPDVGLGEWRLACQTLPKAHRAGVPFMMGTDTGFAGSPYGEWHAREIEIFVKYLDFTPAEALRAATSVNGSFFDDGAEHGTIEAGAQADIVVVDGNPLADVTQLLERSRIREIMLAGQTIQLELPEITDKVSAFSYKMWNDIYSQKRVADLETGGSIRKIA